MSIKNRIEKLKKYALVGAITAASLFPSGKVAAQSDDSPKKEKIELRDDTKRHVKMLDMKIRQCISLHPDSNPDEVQGGAYIYDVARLSNDVFISSSDGLGEFKDELTSTHIDDPNLDGEYTISPKGEISYSNFEQNETGNLVCIEERVLNDAETNDFVDKYGKMLDNEMLKLDFDKRLTETTKKTSKSDLVSKIDPLSLQANKTR